MNGALPPTVALILHFRNHLRTMRCLDSLLPEGICRALIIDNSEDAGASWAQLVESVAIWSAAGLDIVVERPERNLGFSSGVNHGLACIRRRYGAVCVLLLNSDATLRSGAHDVLRRAIDGKPSAIASACMVSHDGVATAFAHYHPFLGLLSKWPIPGAYRYLSACCMLIHPFLARDDLFDEDFFFYGEDIELGWRLLGLGIGQIPVSQAVVDHEGSASSRNGSLFYEYHMARAHLLLPRKLSEPGIGRCAMLLARAVSLPLRAMVRSLRFRSLLPCRGLVLAALDVSRGRLQSLTPLAGSDAPVRNGW